MGKAPQAAKLPKGSFATVDQYPDCDVCKDELPRRAKAVPAHYDARVFGTSTWSYVCERHFRECSCHLGVGWGQKLVLRDATR